MARKMKYARREETPFSSGESVGEIERPLEEKLVMNATVYPYGECGIANYTKHQFRISDEHIGTYATLPYKKLSMSEVLAAQKANLKAVYQSAWLIINRNGNPYLPKSVGNYSLSDYDGVERGVQVDYLSDLLVSFEEHESMWLKNYKRIFDNLQFDFKYLQSVLYKAKYRLIYSPRMTLKKETAELVVDLMALLGAKFFDTFQSTFRFYLFTSSIPGTPREKLEFLKTMPSNFNKVLCLVGDDLNLKQLSIFRKHLGCMATIDVTKVKPDDKFIKNNNKEFISMLKVGHMENYSLIVPPVFIPKRKVEDKLIKYYSRLTNVILY